MELRAGEGLLRRALVVEEGEQVVVRRGGGAPPEDLGDELILLATSVSGVVLQTPCSSIDLRKGNCNLL